jgi:SAM-dependent methyltransferase
MSEAARNADALDRWKRMHSAVEAANSLSRHVRHEDRWQQRAERFDRVSRQRERADPTLQALLAHVDPGDVVVDVGAGTGRHAVPLAGHCVWVGAVEPSPAMRTRLEARIQDEQVTNIAVIPAPWPAAGPLACDVVFSSHVLYGIENVVPFLEAMTRSARRECLLLLGLHAPADAMSKLWRIVHGHEYPVRPAAPEALDVLHQLDYAASLHVLPATEHPVEFGDSAEDLIELCHRLGILADDTGRVRAALGAFRSPDAEGRYLLGTTAPLALIVWPGARSR